MAHGEIRSIDTDGAWEMPGVQLVITAADLDAAGIKNMAAAAGKHRGGTPTPRPLATDRVRYVGEPIAMVVAETPKQAKDAAELIFVDIDALPAVTTASAAAAPDAPQLHADAPGDVCLDFHYGDSEQVAAAFARGAHVTTLSLRNSGSMRGLSAIGILQLWLNYSAASRHPVGRTTCGSRSR